MLSSISAKIVRASSTDKFLHEKIVKALMEQTDASNIEIAIDAVVNDLKNSGFFIIHEVFDDVTCQNFKQQFDECFNYERDVYSEVDEHDGAVCLRLKPLWRFKNQKKFPHFLKFFNSSIFKSITERFFNNSKIDYMSEIFIHRTSQTIDPLSKELHWDRHQTLKFWLYVNDVNKNSGAMRIIPGSAAKNRIIRKNAGDRTKIIGGLENLSNTGEATYLEAKKGSIMIFNTDCSHGASPVAAGHRREIVRGHCRLLGT